MVKKILISSILLNFIIIQFQLFAQKQVESVVKLSDRINSDAEEILPLLSQSGDSLFFARVFHENNFGGKYSGSDIWLSIFDQRSKRWGTPTNQLQKWNDKRNNFIIGINPNEKIIYQNNSKNPEKGIKFVKNLNNYWTKTENISLPGIPNSGYQGMYVSPDYSVILIAMKPTDSFGKEDLYVITKNSEGDWTRPINFGSTINTSESEISPFLSADTKTLFFASKGHGGYGDMDIFMSERLYNSWTVWSKPENLGDKINSSAFDGYYREYGDSLAFFSSNRSGALADIFEVKLKLSSSDINTAVSEKENNPDTVYLNDQDIIFYFGFTFSPTIKFVENTSEITQKSKELLYFISNKMIEVKLLSVKLIYNDKDESLRRSRLASVRNFFQNLNISPDRIIFNVNKPNEKRTDLQIRFYTTTERK